MDISSVHVIHYLLPEYFVFSDGSALLEMKRDILLNKVHLFLADEF